MGDDKRSSINQENSKTIQNVINTDISETTIKAAKKNRQPKVLPAKKHNVYDELEGMDLEEAIELSLQMQEEYTGDSNSNGSKRKKENDEDPDFKVIKKKKH